MFRKNIYLGLVLSTLFSFTAIAMEPIAVALVELRVGDKTEKSIIVIDSKKHTQLSMKNENLGFALKLVNTTGREIFETTPTHDKKPITYLDSGKATTISAGYTLNGYRFEKELAVEFLLVNRVQ
jgi:hypothetical protein